MTNKVIYHYHAEALVAGRTVKVDAVGFDNLVFLLEQKVKEVRYTTDGINSYQENGGPFHESSLKDLIYPEIKWTIEREERDS